jgi:hypothetical protein
MDAQHRHAAYANAIAAHGRSLRRVHCEERNMIALLLQLDGKLPNLALMRIAAHLRATGWDVTLRHAGNIAALEPQLADPKWDAVYASLIFERSRHLGDRVLALYPDAIVGGTGYDLTRTLASVGIDETGPLAYDIYARTSDLRDGRAASVGFTERGCRLQCDFCVVPRKEGKVRAVATIADIWRGDPWPRQILLLDNDFFGNPQWQDRIAELRDGKFKVSFNQGINARMLNDETAAAIASVNYRDDQMREKRIYTAWDGKKDERTLFRGLEALVRAGVKPDAIMVYMLIGHEFGETHEDRDYRRAKLRAFGARPYPMPKRRTNELTGFARWCVGAYDKRIPWPAWKAAGYSPRRLGDRFTLPLFTEVTT